MTKAKQPRTRYLDFLSAFEAFSSGERQIVFKCEVILRESEIGAEEINRGVEEIRQIGAVDIIDAAILAHNDKRRL